MLSKIDIAEVRKIDQEAADILNSAAMAVREILKRRTQLDAEGMQDAPLYVLAGESHFNPCEYLHHILVLAGVKESGNSIACGIEIEHDYYEKDPDIKTPPKDSHKYIYGGFGYAVDNYDGGGAAHGRKTLFSYLAGQRKDKSIKPIFTDASYNVYGELDLKDPYTRSVMKGVKVNKNKVICEEPLGVSIRNGVMLDVLKEFGEKEGSRVIFQLAGLYHVCGGAGAAAERSMSAILDSNKLPHLNIFMEDKPANAHNAKYGQDVLCPDVPMYKAFRRNSLKLILDEAKNDYIRIPENEKQFINAKLDNMGLPGLKVK